MFASVEHWIRLQRIFLIYTEHLLRPARRLWGCENFKISWFLVEKHNSVLDHNSIASILFCLSCMPLDLVPFPFPLLLNSSTSLPSFPCLASPSQFVSALSPTRVTGVTEWRWSGHPCHVVQRVDQKSTNEVAWAPLGLSSPLLSTNPRNLLVIMRIAFLAYPPPHQLECT